ncbi:hypothetical protein N0V93_007305 [Gnomoniopsis smithogilvyi]|uniref:Transmembrane protein 42 n=1 Tax=Gnomoniopsis smithogilvyi TaxID=1191159 RepID=A0A9W8YTF2_9PEZI|nr:hypothetical protein N0V93_007305 [Gnomoniopsis smithogilvyi]
MIRQRRPAAEPNLSTPVPASEKGPSTVRKMHPTESQSGERESLLQRDSDSVDKTVTATSGTMRYIRQNRWMVLAIASGACAAFNGVFAKLTTTDLTTSFSQGIARLLHLDSVENAIEYIVRAMFFGLNLIFNGVMWTLFTQALAKGNSTTQVSIMNTSSNFVITALLGLIIFSESLPPLWWVGAALLVAGNVIIGSQDESDKPTGDERPSDQDGLGSYQDLPSAEHGSANELVTEDMLLKDDDEDVVELGDLDDIDEHR